ncbi:MAG: phage terminase large subunit family protein [Cyanobacteriota bacterium]|nr:phage terminase large subunit family protein [Cyanobacteriota bacterium]
MADVLELLRAARREGLALPAATTVSEWADEHRILSGKGSAEKGPWRTDRTPYLREPMDCLSPNHPVRRVVLMFGSQMGKTEVVLNWLGAIIHLWPGPTMLVQPTIDMAKRLNRQRLDPLLRETPVLAERIAPARSRDAASSMFLKEFPGGLFVVTGANSGSGLQSMPAAYLAADEVSSYPIEADDKGDPLANAEVRTSTFPMGKVLITSTPGTRGACRITKEFEERSDQRRFHAFMPCCGALEVLRWREHMVWDRPDGEVWCKCPACGERVAQWHKTTMLAGAEWRAGAAGDGQTAGFHLPGWYAPAGWTPWEQIRDEFLRAKADSLLLKNWVNTRAAEPWEDEALAKVSADGLIQRASRDGYEMGTVPDGVLLLVGAVDVQDTWLEVSVWGFGRGDEAWRVWHEKVEGDPGVNAEGIEGRGGPWEQVDAIRAVPWKRAGGGEMKVMALAVDSGGSFTQEVYEFCRLRAREGVVAIKGANTKGSPVLGKGSKVDVNWRGQVRKAGLTLYMVGGDALKRTIYSRLKLLEAGPGAVHFGQDVTPDYLEGLTCERLVPRYVKGFQVLEWHKPDRARNEPLDLFVYSLAMLELIKRRYNRATMWDQLEGQLRVGSRPAAVVQPVVRRKSNWLKGGRS